MNNAFDELRSALAQARELDRAIANYANAMGQLLRGRLRLLDGALLAALKRELRDYDMHRRTWKK